VPSRDWAWWCLDGKGARRPRCEGGEWGEGPLLAISAIFCSEFAYVFRLSVSMRKVADEHPFCVLIYMNSYIFHICFILFILLSYLIFDFVCLTLSLVNTHGIAKYVRTYIGRYTHTHAHTKKKNRKGKQEREKSGQERKKQEGGSGKTGRKEERTDKKEKAKKRGRKSGK